MGNVSFVGTAAIVTSAALIFGLDAAVMNRIELTSRLTSVCAAMA